MAAIALACYVPVVMRRGRNTTFVTAALALALSAGCGEKVASTTSAVPDAASEAGAAFRDDGGTADGGEPIDGGQVTDATAGNDGAAGDGCTYVSGEYTGGTAGMCHDILIVCPATVTAMDCASACPTAFVGSDPRPALKCYLEPADAGAGMVFLTCRSPFCQG